MGIGVDENNNTIIDFATPEGFEDAILEILKQAKEYDLEPSVII